VPPRLLIASNNEHKVAEFRALLRDSGWEVIGPKDIGLDLDVEESGDSYAENARIKARAFAKAAGIPALADDSGLEVDALSGQPGPRHHVLGWDGADNAERIAILLRAMEGKPDRRARFRAVIVVAFPDGHELIAEGACEGLIAPAPAGSAGFGYDPVFYLPGLGRTMAELTAEEKNQVSHRGRAAQEVCRRLRELARDGPRS
jgi:XTP/dITP diphosphohydrolase